VIGQAMRPGDGSEGRELELLGEIVNGWARNGKRRLAPRSLWAAADERGGRISSWRWLQRSPPRSPGSAVLHLPAWVG